MRDFELPSRSHTQPWNVDYVGGTKNYKLGYFSYDKTLMQSLNLKNNLEHTKASQLQRPLKISMSWMVKGNFVGK